MKNKILDNRDSKTKTKLYKKNAQDGKNVEKQIDILFDFFIAYSDWFYTSGFT